MLYIAYYNGKFKFIEAENLTQAIGKARARMQVPPAKHWLLVVSNLNKVEYLE